MILATATENAKHYHREASEAKSRGLIRAYRTMATQWDVLALICEKVIASDGAALRDDNTTVPMQVPE